MALAEAQHQVLAAEKVQEIFPETDPAAEGE